MKIFQRVANEATGRNDNVEVGREHLIILVVTKQNKNIRIIIIMCVVVGVAVVFFSRSWLVALAFQPEPRRSFAISRYNNASLRRHKTDYVANPETY